jgi:hypothetical protein
MAVAKQKISAFIREAVHHTFDALSNKIEPAAEGTEATGLQKLAADWRGLTDAERDQLTSLVDSASELTAGALPIAIAASRRTTRRPAAPRKQAAAPAPVKAEKPGKEKKKKKKDKKDKGKKKGKKKKKR